MILVLVAYISHLLISSYSLYNGDECLQDCAPFFDRYETPQTDEGQELLKEFMDMAQMQEFEPRCIINIADYAYMSGESLDTIDLQNYQNTLDTTSKDSPHYCFKELKELNFDDAQNNNLDPRWNGLKINEDLCHKYDTMKLCNVYWPCVANGIKSVCNDRGTYNCTTKSCDCFEGFVNIPIRSRPEDHFVSCDIGIRALFNESLPVIPEDFIIDGSFKEPSIEINEYKLPNLVQLRFWSDAYLLDEFNQAINDINATFVDPKKRQIYLEYITNHTEFMNQNSTLLIGVSMHYIDWDAAPDVRVKSLSELQFRYKTQTPLTAQTKTTRSNTPGWIGINGNGLYIIGERYWLSNETTAIPPKAGIGYTVNLNIEWYSSQSFLKFSKIGKKEIEFEFAKEMEISPMRITWIKFIESNTTNINIINIMIDTTFAITTNQKDVIDYFKDKHETNTEFTPPHDISGSIKSILKLRKSTISHRAFGGMIIGEIRYPQLKDSSAMTEHNISKAFRIGFQRVLKINIKYINTDIDVSGVSKMLNIMIFANEDMFTSLYARLQDKEDPITGYLSDKSFSMLLENEMRFIQNQLVISFDSWKVISSNDLFAAWYQMSIFATQSEINAKSGITIAAAKEYVNGFKESLLDGISGSDAKTPEIVWYFNIEQQTGRKYRAEMKVTADYVKKIQEIENDAIISLMDISLKKGWGLVDADKTNAVARVSIFSSIFVDENIINAEPAAYFNGFPKGDTLIAILKELVSDSDHTVHIDILSAETTSRSNVLKITVEFYLEIEQEPYADGIIKTIKNPKFAKLINEEALSKNVNIFATEVTIIYPSKLNSNVDTWTSAKVEISETESSIFHQTNNNASIVTDIVLPRFLNKYWPIRLPVDIFCSEFYTDLQFGTSISFGFLKQYMCIQLVNMIPGKGKILLKTKLIYKPKQPGAPDGLSTLCDYWAKVQTGEAEPNPSMDQKLQNGGPGMEKTCQLLAVGKELMPDNIPDTFGNVAAMSGGQIEIMSLPDIILKDPRPNPKFPSPDLLKSLGIKEQPLNQSNITTNQNMEETYQSRAIYDKIPPDAYVICGGIVALVILQLIRRRQKQKRLRREMLSALQEDMEQMENIAKASKLTAEEYKAIYAKAKEKVDKADFAKYEKRKKRKQKWADLEEKEKQQKKRERLQKIDTEKRDKMIPDQDQHSQSDTEYGSTSENEVGDEASSCDDFDKLFESEATQESYTNDSTEETYNISQ